MIARALAAVEGMTEEAAAERLHVSHQTVRDWRAGKVPKRPTKKTLQALQAALAPPVPADTSATVGELLREHQATLRQLTTDYTTRVFETVVEGMRRELTEAAILGDAAMPTTQAPAGASRAKRRKQG